MQAKARPFRIDIPQSQLDDLTRRLNEARWPDQETSAGWTQGVPLDFMKEIVAYWRRDYDWRRCEARLNTLPHFVVNIDGLDIHFLHLQSKHAEALPVILTHGWPGSFIEFVKTLSALTDPTAHGGRSEDAFHVVVPSLPGVAFSQHPTESGWSPRRVAEAWIELMRHLDYPRWIAQGGDWGAMVTDTIGSLAPRGCLGIHLNMAIIFPKPADLADPTPYEAASARTLNEYLANGSGYFHQQTTRPQTLAYSLCDSPVGQAAWMLEKFAEWSDHDGDPRSTFTVDELLDNVMLYWLNGCGGSSARLYWDTAQAFKAPSADVDLPTGVSIFPKELIRPSRRWAERRLRNIVYWNELSKGGHFAALEQPEVFVAELRRFAQSLRRSVRSHQP